MSLYKLALAAGALLAAGLAPGESQSRVIRTVTPVEIDAPLTNPYRGWGIWAGPRYFDGRQFSLD